MDQNDMALATTSTPEIQTAIIANASGDLVISKDIPLPVLEPDMVLVKTGAVGVNPVDVKLTGPMASEGAVAGSDCAGTIVAISPNIPASRFSIGDRVCTAVPPMNPLKPRVGAFAEYVGAYANFTLRVPDRMSLECAATLGVALTTIGYALFRSLKIPGHPEQPAANSTYVLIYGGSTASGTMAIQLVRRSGLIPITTCSPKNFELVMSYGAEKAFDYHDPNSAAEIRALTRNALSYALDCFCEGSSMKFCYAALGRAGGRYTTLEPYSEHSHTRKMVKPEWVLGPAILGQDVGWKDPYGVKANPDIHAFGVEWFACAQRMLDRGELRPHPAKVSDGVGFAGILDGIESLSRKEVSGQKLVYRVTEI